MSKKHNQHKLRVIRNAQRILNRISICHIYAPSQDNKECHLVFDKNTPVKVTPSLAWHLQNLRVHWEILAGVFCRDQSGKNYALYTLFQAERECISVEISTLAENACKRIFNDAIKMHRLCPFWIAIPRSDDKNDLADRLILLVKTAHYFKVFNRIATEFEINVNMPFKDHHNGDWFNVMEDFDFREAEIEIADLYGEQPEFKHLIPLQNK